MSPPPNHIDLPLRTPDGRLSAHPSPSNFPSPRTGDVPPPLSPLDAFAYQSSLLAKQLDKVRENGRRVSRIPPLTLAKELAKPRPGYPFPLTEEADEADQALAARTDEMTRETNLEVRDHLSRHQSVHLSVLSGPSQSIGSAFPGPRNSASPDTTSQLKTPVLNDYFASSQASSPRPLIGTDDDLNPSAALCMDSAPSYAQPRCTSDNQSRTATDLAAPNLPESLAPPEVPSYPPSPFSGSSIRSVPMESGDEADAVSAPRSPESNVSRKPSAISNAHLAYLSQATLLHHHARSTSLNSESSVGGTRVTKPIFNFSRPLSRSSQPSTEARSSFDSRHGLPVEISAHAYNSRLSFEAHTDSDVSPSRSPVEGPSITGFEDAAHSPMSDDSEDVFTPKALDPEAASSYIYSKFLLPRGRKLKKQSLDARGSSTHDFGWLQPPSDDDAAPATPSEHHGSSAPPTPPDTDEREPRPRTSRETRYEGPLSLAELSKYSPGTPLTNHNLQTPSSAPHEAIRGSSDGIKSRSVSMTPEEHLERGIDAHEKGGRDAESTYHLRLAARAGLPTAMLLYGLACRHGWGVRPNQTEAVKWLKKAVDCSGLEVADGESLDGEGQATDPLERKSRKAQYALSIYELGMSYMNGWGTQQDKALALRCFEIAGNWGDADALAEAGFCYSQGNGCKKDLKKAAGYYRAAEAKGVSMAGNSWIHKEKYRDDYDEANSREGREKSEQKPRDKSRTRTMFKRKKAESTP